MRFELTEDQRALRDAVREFCREEILPVARQIDETEKMWRICAANVRDAAVTASVQRIMHYKIAGYGAIAAYAKALGRTTEAAHFAQLADRDKAVDSELSELAKGTLNPEAAVAPKGEPAAREEPARTH